jgi:hypothetical protein
MDRTTWSAADRVDALGELEYGGEPHYPVAIGREQAIPSVEVAFGADVCYVARRRFDNERFRVWEVGKRNPYQKAIVFVEPPRCANESVAGCGSPKQFSVAIREFVQGSERGE